MLIVDDDYDAREMYAAYLSRSGFSAHTAYDGPTAIAMAFRLTPDLIVMDLSMPIMDGITVTQRIRQHARMSNVPVILLTGYPFKAIERGALEHGIDLFLMKPCLPEDLEAHVRRLLESKRKT